MKKVTILFVFFLSMVNLSFAQTGSDVKEGKKSRTVDLSQMVGVEDAELIDQIMITVRGVGSSAKSFLNAQSVKPYMMPVRRIGVRGTDFSYALASCLEFYVNLEKNYKVNLSPDYISLSLQASGKPVSFKDAMAFLMQSGTVDAAIMPYDSPSLTNAVYNTQKFKITNYLHIFRSVTKEQQKVYEVRKALMRGNPVVAKIKASSAIRGVSGEDMLSVSAGSEEFTFVVVGYDENKKALELMSSWGSTWGDNGYIWVSYSDFGKLATDGFVMLPTNM